MVQRGLEGKAGLPGSRWVVKQIRRKTTLGSCNPKNMGVHSHLHYIWGSMSLESGTEGLRALAACLLAHSSFWERQFLQNRLLPIDTLCQTPSHTQRGPNFRTGITLASPIPCWTLATHSDFMVRKFLSPLIFKNLHLPPSIQIWELRDL